MDRMISALDTIAGGAAEYTRAGDEAIAPGDALGHFVAQ